MVQPIILCGLGRVGWRVLEYLHTAGLPAVVVDSHCSPTDARLREARLVKGDCRRRDVLEQAGAASARGVLIMTNDDLVNISTALVVRHLNRDVRIVMRLFNQNLIARLGKTFQNIYALSTATLTAPLFALSALTGQALGTIRLEGTTEGPRQLAEATITAGSPLRGKRIAEVTDNVHVQVVGHRPAGGKDRLLIDVDLQAPLIPGDHLIVCGEPHDIASLLEPHDPALADVRWAGWLRRMGRVAWRTLGEVDLPVKICTAVLFGVILISSIVLKLQVPKYSLIKSVYQTICIMATAGDMHLEEFRDNESLMVFASVMRISGAALVAAFTAILTNYLLRARLSGALEFRRIPDSGHVIVCGLGNIGFRVVEELVRAKERVVAIEQSRDSRFVATARRLGVPVLTGDATVSAVLLQAHAPKARAVVAATSDDLINLEVGLMARELNPTQRVVLHLSDPNLAQMLREAANIRLALSIPVLAAPAFVAALFGDRVQSAFMIGGRMLAAVDLVIPEQDPCLLGQSVRALATDYRLLPVAVFDSQGILQQQPASIRLQEGWRLVAITALSDLERLLRREPARQDYTVEVTAFPADARPGLTSLLCRQQGCHPDTAARLLDQLPVCLGGRYSRGQGEDLVLQLQAEQIRSHLRPLNGAG
jgi:Trk K+ transport system NAD-binding subunit